VQAPARTNQPEYKQQKQKELEKSMTKKAIEVNKAEKEVKKQTGSPQ